MRTFPMMMAVHRTAVSLACLQARLQQCLLDLVQRPSAGSLDPWLRALRDCAGSLLALPFDLARAQHAAGVRAGALPRSMLESMRFEQRLVTMERLALGTLARRF